MASDTVHTAEFNLKDLTIKSVTLSLNRGMVVWEMADVPIHPGPNKITIYGLDPQVDQDSIRVTGRGRATITDIQTETVPQRERFEDVFPEDDSEDNSSIIDEEDPDDDFGVDRSELIRAEQDLKKLTGQLEEAENEQASAKKSLEFLQVYGKTMKSSDAEVSKMEQYLKLYTEESAKLFKVQKSSEGKKESLQPEIDKLTREMTRLSIAFTTARDAAARPKRQAREKKRQARDMKLQEKRRLRNDKLKFWPHTVAQVVLHLDGSPGSTPASSRRSSVGTISKRPESANQTVDSTVSFSLSYVTTQANWSPRYELELKTPTSKGKIVYCAEYYNLSTETWEHANITLSTSQTTFSGLEETNPVLQPWNVKLHKDEQTVIRPKTSSHWQDSLENKAEVDARNAQRAWNSKPKYRNDLVNLPPPPPANMANGPVSHPPPPPPPRRSDQIPGATSATYVARGIDDDAGNKNLQDYQDQLVMLEQQNKRRMMPSSAMPRQVHAQVQPPQMQQMQQQHIQPLRQLQQQQAGIYLYPNDSAGDDDENEDIDVATLSEDAQVLAFQESSRQEYGLTTTYNIPGQRTIRPSMLKRRHVIAELDFPTVTFSHVVVPKLRPAAFLKARIRNTSSVNLLRGNAGLTLDGTFLGTTRIPACSAGSFFSLSLGIDPGIQVTYAKPSARRITSGFFAKEDCATFTRTCRIQNTKTTSISINVLDQVPVSEDEGLRVNILEPKGLNKDGDTVKVRREGESNAGATDNNWGKGAVRMGKGGIITWDLTVEKGKTVKLILEYEARIPSGQQIVGLD